MELPGLELTLQMKKTVGKCFGRVTNSGNSYFYCIFLIKSCIGNKVYYWWFCNFFSRKCFIPKLPFLLLQRGVQKWWFAKYCLHFSFITLIVHTCKLYDCNIKKFFSSLEMQFVRFILIFDIIQMLKKIIFFTSINIDTHSSTIWKMKKNCSH